MTTIEIAQRIDAYLRRFEKDDNTKIYYGPLAYASGGWVIISYVRYHPRTSLRKQDAERYLAWLDAGNTGRHFEAFRDDAP